MQWLVRIAIEFAHELFGQGGADVATALQYRAHRAQQLFGRSAFLDEAARSGTQHVQRVLPFRVAAQDQHAGAVMNRTDLLQDVDAAAVRHADVEDDQIPVLGAQPVERLAAGRGLADGADAAILDQKLLESGADYGMVVSEQHTCHGRPISVLLTSSPAPPMKSRVRSG